MNTKGSVLTIVRSVQRAVMAAPTVSLTDAVAESRRRVAALVSASDELPQRRFVVTTQAAA